MSIEGDIREVLLASPSIKSKVGQGTQARIRPNVLMPEDNPLLDHIIINVDSMVEQNDLSGIGGLEIGRVSILCRSLTVSGARDLAGDVRGVLAGYTGSGTFDSVLESEEMDALQFDDASGRVWYQVSQSYTVIV